MRAATLAAWSLITTFAVALGLAVYIMGGSMMVRVGDWLRQRKGGKQ